MTDDKLERLWVEERSRLIRACTLIVGSVTEAADAVDEAFVNTLARDRRASVDDLRAYLWRAALNEVARTSRRGRRRRQLEGLAMARPVPVQPLDEAIGFARVTANALSELDHTSRAVLVLRFYCDLSVSDVAQHLRRSEGAVKTITRRALIKLRNDLGTSDVLIEEGTAHD